MCATLHMRRAHVGRKGNMPREEGASEVFSSRVWSCVGELSRDWDGPGWKWKGCLVEQVIIL